ncbi:nucleoside-diphosphate-sugar epimerase [Rhodoligotrophos appendicifer]|uniref:SDR family oxidoreductase n=1 Tax=Rhodoligotrophos appendicifer TaxID=987056 RepID=UPI001185F662|nr:SDR family oxidoreductase [Rhodoligotrophos appendicifer]
MKNTILIVGALGTVGRAALEYFETLPDWNVVGVSRRSPDFATQARWVSADLRDADDVKAKLGSMRDITHIAYAAVFEKADVTKGWAEADHAEINLGMLRNLVTTVEKASPKLQHISVLQGTKAYGAHLGPFRMPARESDPRYMPPNFYYDQMDWLAEFQTGKDWTWTIFRPQIVCGLALGSPLNVVTAIGVFAAISREFGMPLRYPGGPEKIGEATDARLIAKAMEWAASSPSAANEVFNVANGDIYIWQNLWPAIAQLFRMEHAPPNPFSLARIMPQNEAIWDRIVERHSLARNSYKSVVPSWQFADYLLGYGQRPNPHHVSTIKIRKAGFHECVDTEEMFLGLLAELQRRRVLPD